MFNFKKKKRSVQKFFDFSFYEKPKPVAKTKSASLNKKVNRALKKSGGKCVTCRKRNRVGSTLFCRKCHF